MFEIYKYRQLLSFLVRKELKIKYRNTMLGYFWSLLEPLGLMIIYTIVFSIILRFGIENYSLFLLSGLIPWMFVNHSVLRGTKSLTSNSSLLKKVYFPRQIFPLTTILTNLVNLGISLLLVAAYSYYLGVGISLAGFFILPVAIVLQFILVLSIVLLLSSINVYYRDIEFISTLGIRGWMYLSPILYPISEIPEQYLSLYMLNPMATIISLYHFVFYGGDLIPVASIVYSALFSILLLLFCWQIFNKLSKNIGEVI
ncbi:ABC transporter permease [Halalkalibacter alkalisediminis]|uniref:Transport permease protein n=1 Tax=Halalkalibacter alkalisediminis TaxID=935616 RepID=A0ABV6NET4_9BACI|nr:ABC transporter permease [Halalkalibacter alkalisediminis]